MGFDKQVCVEANGFAGGIWVMWQEGEVKMEEVTRAAQSLHMRVNLHNGQTGYLTAVYGSSVQSSRRALWDTIRDLAVDVEGPWLLTGDINALLGPYEKQGGAPFNLAPSREFKDCVDECGLIDVEFSGQCFTWQQGSLRQILDCALCNSDWRQSFPEMNTLHLPKLKSDHRPILTCSNDMLLQDPSRKPFRFLAPWLLHYDFPHILQEGWLAGLEYKEAVIGLTSALCRWNKEVFGNVLEKKRKLANRLCRLEELNEQSPSPTSLHQEECIRNELMEVLKHEEILWYQKSREKWFVHGDSNTRFFHLSTLKRRCRNCIRRLKSVSND
ncbi:unnamed protein product [Linum trigynum]|uniref:Uncharacterized protein n=1 Tax=Linum trigynum TaxID=586398 RepID=A0AAV2G8C6_9ROSI